tara:strand:+ start:1087 stop:1506 length:420 start_codon:yes stop_codon:yes gene_type:complete
MSNENQATLPEPADAYNNLFEGVHANVFFGKLANHGFQPQSEKEAADLLQLAGRLRHVDETEKAANANRSRFAGPTNALDNVMEGAGLGNAGAAQASNEEGQAIKSAAAQLAREPVFYNSVLSLKAHEAAVLAQQNGGN